ncbi:hypothetical protein ABI59_05040 [Acidobacteria bacterium Mor1]|nr:hypothetical protein ABI59_05040 [Acidobacteria bacterium Mor1]
MARPRNAQSSGPAPETIFTLSEEETFELGRNVAKTLTGGELLLLDGDLGLGKTVFARGVAAGLGVAPEDVTSPSFTLVQEYKGGRTPLFHIDLYRMSEDDPDELGTLGIEEILSSGGIAVIEWGDRLPRYHQRGAIRVVFYDLGEGSRRIEIIPSKGEPGEHRGDA